MVRCAIHGCKNYENNRPAGVKMNWFGLPKNEVLRKEWIKYYDESITNIDGSKVCSSHFHRQEYMIVLSPDQNHDQSYSQRPTLFKTAVPSLRLGNQDSR